MKKSNFEAALASDMDAILNDKNFDAIFKKASVLTKAASEEMCAHDCKSEHEHDHKHDDKCEKADKADANDGAITLEAAVNQALNSLRVVSEVLDEVGLEKTAALSLNLANYIMVEAKKKDDKKKSDKKKADDKKKSDENDAKKKPAAKKDEKKSDKKDEKKSDKKENPFAKKK